MSQTCLTWSKESFWMVPRVIRMLIKAFTVLHKEGPFFVVFFTFPAIFSVWRVVWSWLFYHCKELLLGNLLHTYNMIVGCVENFLATPEVKFSSKNRQLDKSHPFPKWLPPGVFSWSFLHFLRYFMFDASCGHDFFTIVKSYSWEKFYIPITWS